MKATLWCAQALYKVVTFRNTYILHFTHHSALVIPHHHSAKYSSQIFCILHFTRGLC